jgi:hypothetical protein
LLASPLASPDTSPQHKESSKENWMVRSHNTKT